MSHFWIKLIASGCFLGYSPLISGTVGSLGGLFLYIAWILCGLNWFFYCLFVLILLVLGTWVSTRFESISGKKDPGIVVIDEIVGMMITYFLVPFQWKWLLIGFVLFRILDIFKPFPARQCENLKGGVGIMMDDVVSGLYACLLLHLIILLT